MVRLFAMLRERAGRSDWSCDIPAGARTSDVWHALIVAHPTLAEFTGAVSCAVNEDFATLDTAVHDGDDVAFLPPVSGGARSTSQA